MTTLFLWLQLGGSVYVSVKNGALSSYYVLLLLSACWMGCPKILTYTHPKAKMATRNKKSYTDFPDTKSSIVVMLYQKCQYHNCGESTNCVLAIRKRIITHLNIFLFSCSGMQPYVCSSAKTSVLINSVGRRLAQRWDFTLLPIFSPFSRQVSVRLNNF